MYINNKARSKDMSRSVIKYYVQDAHGQTLGEFYNQAEASEVVDFSKGQEIQTRRMGIRDTSKIRMKKPASMKS
jgi:hypothetical protein